MASSALDERRLRRLLEVGRGLVEELDREAVLLRVLEVARELTRARYAALGVLNSERSGLERFLTSGLDAKTRQTIGDLPLGRGLLGELITNPEPLRLREISEHPRSYGFPPGHPPMESFLGVPVRIRGEAWGNLYLSEKAEGAEFDEQDQESLVVLAEWAGIAIENARLYESVEGRRAELERAVRGLEATTAIARAVGGETDLDRVLELVVKRGRALVEARTLVILLADGDGLVVASVAGEIDPGVVGTRIPSAGTAPGHVLRSGHVERLADTGARVRLGLGGLADEAQTAMLVPLTFRARNLGVLVAMDRIGEVTGFAEDDERLMRAFAASAATAVATAQNVEAEQLRLSIQSAENERGRWARELHDETLQGLGALQVLLTSALQADDAAAAKQAARTAVEQVEGEIERLQALITELRPAALDDIGLAPALASLIDRARTLHGIEIHSELDLDHEAGRQPTRLVPELESTTYRLVQEALNNIAKHAGAEHAWVRVTEADNLLHIQIRDDGRGFDPTKPAAGFGLVGMRERVDLLVGQFQVESTPGSGTTVRAELNARHLPLADETPTTEHAEAS